MSPIRRAARSPYFLAVQLFLEIVATAVIILIGAQVYAETRTQHAICQLVEYAGKQNNAAIATNSALVINDMRIGTSAAKADIVTRRKAILKETDAKTFIDKITC